MFNHSITTLASRIPKLVFLCFISCCYAQNDSAYFYFDTTTPITLLKNRIAKSNNENEKAYYKLVYHSRLRNSDSMAYFISVLENNKQLSAKQQCKILYFTGFRHKITNNDSLSYKLSHQAYVKAIKYKDTLTELHSLSALSQTYDYNNDRDYNLEYLNLLEEKSNTYKSPYFKVIHRFLLGNYYLFRDQNKEALSNYRKLLAFKFTKRDSVFLLYTYNNLGALFQENLESPDSAIYYYRKKLDFFIKSPSYASQESYFNTYLNIANAYKSKNYIKEAENYYLKADSVSTREHIVFNTQLIKENLSDLYALKQDYKKAYENLKISNSLLDSLNIQAQRESIANIKEQYDNQKLRADNLESEYRRIQNRNLLYGSLGLVLFVALTAFLIHKNTRKKQLLAEQEKTLETQKLATVLKEQELTTIDAMIEGQEKERQRIANDLHDDLGSLMTTVKWQFDAFQANQSPEFFDKTKAMLEEAYQKIRSIAHAKNSGVIAKQGLLKAVQHMAEKLSHSNKITIEVVDHGLDERLENSLELTLFRIIQELITNIVKHSGATEATIHITNHDDSLNILVEDNGRGFNTNHVISKNKGMGISSIDKRIEHLNGTMVIESEPEKGTTIIIDIPLV